MEEPSFFDGIPDRILLEIFKLLDLRSLAITRLVNKRFYDVITKNSKYLPKPTKSFKILAAKDGQDNPTVEFQCNDCEEYVICCSPTEIVAKPPFYIDYGVNLETDGHFNKRWKMEQAFRHTFSRTIGDGREFDESHPLPATSLANSFEEALNFYLSHFHISSLYLNEYYRDFTAEEMNLILQCVKANRTTVSSMSKQTEVLDYVLIDLIRRTRMIFNLEELKKLSDPTPKDLKTLLAKQINQFTREINKKFVSHAPKKETKKKMFEITLHQETTKAAFTSIQAYQKMLQTEKQLVLVDCMISDNRLSFNIGHIREQFKAPITALSRIEWTRFAPDDIEDMAEKAAMIVSSHLDPAKLAAHPTIADFSHIINDEKVERNEQRVKSQMTNDI